MLTNVLTTGRTGSLFHKSQECVVCMGVTLYTFEVPLGTPMKKVGTSGTPMLEALLKVYTNV